MNLAFLLAQSERDDFWHALLILPVGVAEKTDQIFLLIFNGAKYIGSCDDGKNQVTYGHRGRRPEGEQPADVERVAHIFIGTRSLEADRRWPSSGKM